MKKILAVHDAPKQHWVGDGFPVRSMITYHGDTAALSPFLMLDYAAPMKFEPAVKPRGVGEHPHRGFETVTIVYQGEVEHRDNSGGGGKIGPGDVQWMTAASGIIHDEFHSREFTRSGGLLEMVQLWVNLPAKDKKAAPGYQSLLSRDIPVVELANHANDANHANHANDANGAGGAGGVVRADSAGQLRVIAGEYRGQRGPAHTFTPMDVWDVRLNEGRSVEFSFAEGRTVALVVLHGTVLVNGVQMAREAQLVLLDRRGDQVSIEANTDAVVLVLSGEPIDEPVVGYGPFVMNSEAEIRQAISDFNSGRFGQGIGAN
jgi:redox-sensitive bicupin YhaK (pirin superfamily)